MAIRQNDVFALRIHEDLTVKNGRKRTTWTVLTATKLKGHPVTTDQRHPTRLRLDVPSLLLAFIGLMFGAVAYSLVATDHINPLVMVPPVVALTVGTTHLIKRAPRD